jgi:predicted  nucleic acid-binding Zn-ribbon protein
MEKILAKLGEIWAVITGTSEKLDKIVAAEERVKSLDADLATAKQTIGSLTAELETVKANLQKAQEEANGKDAEISTLKASIETEKNRANAVIASQALPVEQLPAAAVTQTITGNPVAPGLDPKLKGNARLLAHFSKK